MCNKSKRIRHINDGVKQHLLPILTIQFHRQRSGIRGMYDGGLAANEAGSTGTVTIEGPGSSWTANGDGVAGRGTIQIGNLGNGTLIVRDSGAIASVDGYVGSEAGSNSAATITGSGSTWTNSRDFFVGHNSGAVGTVTVSQGGKLTADGHMQIGNLFGSTGALTVTDAGSSVVVGADRYPDHFRSLTSFLQRPRSG